MRANLLSLVGKLTESLWSSSDLVDATLEYPLELCSCSVSDRCLTDVVSSLVSSLSSQDGLGDNSLVLSVSFCLRQQMICFSFPKTVLSRMQNKKQLQNACPGSPKACILSSISMDNKSVFGCLIAA